MISMVENVFNPLNSDDKNLAQKKTFISFFFVKFHALVRLDSYNPNA